MVVEPAGTSNGLRGLAIRPTRKRKGEYRSVGLLMADDTRLAFDSRVAIRILQRMDEMRSIACYTRVLEIANNIISLV